MHNRRILCVDGGIAGNRETHQARSCKRNVACRGSLAFVQWPASERVRHATCRWDTYATGRTIAVVASCVPRSGGTYATGRTIAGTKQATGLLGNLFLQLEQSLIPISKHDRISLRALCRTS